MKIIAAVLFLSLQFAGSAFAAHTTDRAESENVLEQRQRNLRKKAPLNDNDKALLKRLLSEKKLTRVDLSEDQYLPDSNDPLFEAMRKSATKKIDNEEDKKKRNERNEGEGNCNTTTATDTKVLLSATQATTEIVLPTKATTEALALTKVSRAQTWR